MSCKFNVIEYFEEFLIPDLQKMINAHLHHYAFIVICQGIEILGSCFDQKEFNNHKLSETRFRIGLKKLFKNIKYKNNQSKLYQVLRGPMIHQLRPGGTIYLCSKNKDKIPSEYHLQLTNNKAIIFVIEEFFKDFQNAFSNFKKLSTSSGIINQNKIKETYIMVEDIILPAINKEHRTNKNIIEKLIGQITKSIDD